ncbi:hypothetical protein B1C78_00605 [Thioalkalivibrio denitrificans]|uniref:Uncharacterized protein n=1 Tax=Thioalkalivibrio denitrificans TaxID=108003 RepID=A0A1V3NUS2_9GAMM|nr:hypothetical protein [Thioalkalivibrio denitrificans]OOG28867.1 hypothetical protein B1C78_00605 [Thioalkalivibrio denitrificans]
MKSPYAWLSFGSHAGAKRRRRELQTECEAALLEMRQLQETFRSRYPNAPAWLTVSHRARSGRGLWWRMRAKSPQAQSIFELSGERGRKLLATLPPALRAAFLDYNQHAGLLNLAYTIRSLEQQRIDTYVERTEALAQQFGDKTHSRG